MENINKAKLIKGKPWKKVLLIIGIVIALLAAASYIFIHIELSKINPYVPDATIAPKDETFETEDQEPLGSAEIVDPNTITWPADIEQFNSPDIFNILLIGQDRRSGQSRQRSDSMIILSYNKADKTIKLVSLMRDMYLQIPGYSDNRINAAYQFGGMELLDATITKNFGVTINGNLEVDFSGFSKIVDYLGGIDIEISDYDAAHLNKKFGWSLIAGVNHLDGEQTMQYSRIRYVGNADYERTERQRNVLNIIINKALALNTADQLIMLDAVLPYLTTDMTKYQILGYCYTVLQNGIEGIEKYRIPANSAYKSASIRGMSVLVPDININQKLLMEYLLQ